MHIRDILSARRTTFSFEFFPPKTDEAAEQLFGHIRELEALKPSFVSVTYGAGGSTRERTHNLVVRIKETTTLDAVPHLTCVMHGEAEIEGILQRYAMHKVSNILALGGDPPRPAAANTGQAEAKYDRSKDAFKHAADLVRFIKQFNERHLREWSMGGDGAGYPGGGFGIGVAGFPEGHPATPNRTLEMDHLKAKVEAGADYIVTQLFFDNRDFYDFRERCELAGIHVPVIAGLMPVTSLGTYKRIPELALGARYPARLQRAILRAGGDAEAVRAVGVHWATEQARDLLDHQVKGIHFYTLNTSAATREIYKSLGIRDSLNV
jgi:methylenetetrahydrofolate reductase (NADPH)